MKKILFLNDYSKNATHIYDYVLQLAKHFHAQINIAHFFEVARPVFLEDDIAIAENYYGHNSKEFDDQLRAEKEKSSTFLADHTPKEMVHLIGREYVLEANYTAEMLELIEKEQMELVVMGMNQQNRLKDAIFGNLSTQMIEKAKCPVLLIPPNSKTSNINDIVFAADFTNFNDGAIEYLLGWAKLFEAKLHVLHVNSKFYDEMMAEEKSREWNLKFRKEIENKRLAFFYNEGDTEATIQHFLKNVNADLICLSTHVRGFWGRLLEPSLTKDLAKKLDIPMLVLKPKEKIFQIK